jgi:hypothetical protein
LSVVAVLVEHLVEEGALEAFLAQQIFTSELAVTIL